MLGIIIFLGFFYYLEDFDCRFDFGRFVDHVKYIVDLVGVDHVAIVMDYDETWTEEMWIVQFADMT